jgi:citrate lyase subunit beta/citryl-CoA lyase
MSSKQLPPWRSILYVPVNVDKYVKKAAQSSADAILLDLEDSIDPDSKDEARQKLAGAIESLTAAGRTVGVRINRPLGMAARDIEAAVAPGVRFIVLPKIENAAHVRLISAYVEEMEESNGVPQGSVELIATIEAPKALFCAEEIATADERLIGLTLGGEDFSLACDTGPSSEAIVTARHMVILAARAAGILPLGLITSSADFSHLEGYREVARRSSAAGFAGAYAMHPAQVDILNEAFSPSSDDLAYAKALLAARDDGQGPIKKAFAFRGKMIDKPIIERAERLLERVRRLNLLP